MHVYDCKVRLGGSLHNEVFKPDVTAPEILVLREIHGNDAVVDIRPRRVDHRPNEGEHDRLRANYNPVLVERMFGPPYKELPRKLPDRELPELVEPDQIAEPTVRRRAARKPASTEAPVSDGENGSGEDLLN